MSELTQIRMICVIGAVVSASGLAAITLFGVVAALLAGALLANPVIHC